MSERCAFGAHLRRRSTSGARRCGGRSRPTVRGSDFHLACTNDTHAPRPPTACRTAGIRRTPSRVATPVSRHTTISAESQHAKHAVGSRPARHAAPRRPGAGRCTLLKRHRPIPGHVQPTVGALFQKIVAIWAAVGGKGPETRPKHTHTLNSAGGKGPETRPKSGVCVLSTQVLLGRDGQPTHLINVCTKLRC